MVVVVAVVVAEFVEVLDVPQIVVPLVVSF
jgi:hypothetical protein